MLFTGLGQPLTTAEREFLFPANQPLTLVNIEFGFATEEILTPGEFLDSFTLTVSASGGAVATLVTADASGFAWLPVTPGGFSVPEGALSFHEISFPSLNPVLPNQRAYALSLAVPTEFQGGPVTFTFDLFDNQNAVRSYGYFTELVVVPEPSAGLLLVCGSVLGWWLSRNRKRQVP